MKRPYVCVPNQSLYINPSLARACGLWSGESINCSLVNCKKNRAYSHQRNLSFCSLHAQQYIFLSVTRTTNISLCALHAQPIILSVRYTHSNIYFCLLPAHQYTFLSAAHTNISYLLLHAHQYFFLPVTCTPMYLSVRYTHTNIPFCPLHVHQYIFLSVTRTPIFLSARYTHTNISFCPLQAQPIIFLSAACTTIIPFCSLHAQQYVRNTHKQYFFMCTSRTANHAFCPLNAHLTCLPVYMHVQPIVFLSTCSYTASLSTCKYCYALFICR